MDWDSREIKAKVVQELGAGRLRVIAPKIPDPQLFLAVFGSLSDLLEAILEPPGAPREAEISQDLCENEAKVFRDPFDGCLRVSWPCQTASNAVL